MQSTFIRTKFRVKKITVNNMKFRLIERNEIEKIRDIDRSELIENVYYYKNKELSVVSEHHEISGWDPINLENIITNLYTLFDRKGYFYGAFEKEKLVGISVLDSDFIGINKKTLLLDFLHIDRKYRKTGLGKSLFELAAKRAKELGAKKLYISATPSKNTVQFYFHIGCRLTEELNKELYELEPEDIHLQLDLNDF